MLQYSAVGNVAMICVKRFSALLGFFPIQILIFRMSRNSADVRRCSYFELGLPMHRPETITLNRRKARWEDGNILHSAFKPKSFVWGDPSPR